MVAPRLLNDSRVKQLLNPFFHGRLTVIRICHRTFRTPAHHCHSSPLLPFLFAFIRGWFFNSVCTAFRISSQFFLLGFQTILRVDFFQGSSLGSLRADFLSHVY